MSTSADHSPERSQSRQPITVSPEREAAGKKLIIFAWVIEVLAVMIGLAIALMQGMTSFAELEANFNGELGVAHYTNIVIAMLPFIMVAAVEATKIPFVEAAYKTTLTRWKIVFGAGLVFLAFITFESALNGFERNFQALIYAIDQYKKELVAVEEEIEPLSEQRDKLASLTSTKIESDYNQRHAVISEERNRQAGVIQERVQALRAATQTEYIKSLQDQIEDRRSQIKAVRAERQNELDNLFNEARTMRETSSSELNLQRRSLQQQLLKEQELLDAVITKSERDIEEAGFFSESSVRERSEQAIAEQSEQVERVRTQLNSLSNSTRQDELRQQFERSQAQVKRRYESQLNGLNAELKSLSLELSKSLGARDKDVELAVSNHMRELKRVEQQFSDQQNENERIRDSEFDKLARNEELITGLDAELFGMKQRRVELRNKINIKVGDNQVYRMAQWWYGKESAADLDRRDVMFIATLWFGSLALLIAVTGILLALASYVIRDPSISSERSSTGSYNSSFNNNDKTRKLVNSLRRYVIHRRKLLREPRIKEVIKEVPVDRVVMVNKPVEIIKKEIVHVPLYTDDLSLIREQQAQQETSQNEDDESGAQK